jgi:hypothetical protein
MKVDTIRLKKHLSDIVRSAHDLKMIVDQNTLLPDSVELKMAKYILPKLSVSNF